jgi:zinc transport system ATP-binding protein
MINHNSCGLCRIDIENLSVKSGSDILIDDINISLHCGELTALIGKNGAGKTTLLKAILGERQYSGKITFVSHTDGKIKRPSIGYVPQYMTFDKSTPVSVADFMIACKSNRPVWFGTKKEDIKKLEERLSALDCAHVINKRMGDLSGGELQRVMLTAALDPLPDLLILDEPVSGVDAAGLDLFYKTVTSIRDKYHISILLVSHDLGLIRKYADTVVLLDKTVVASGEIEDVFSTEAFKNAFGYLE